MLPSANSTHLTGLFYSLCPVLLSEPFGSENCAGSEIAVKC